VKAGSLASFALLSDHMAHALQLLGHMLVRSNDVVKGIGDLSRQSDPRSRKAHGEVSIAHTLQRSEYHIEIKSLIVRLGLSIVLRE
jgi:hypothetical protein